MYFYARVCAMYVLVPMKARREHTTPRAGVADICEPPDLNVGN